MERNDIPYVSMNRKDIPYVSMESKEIACVGRNNNKPYLKMPYLSMNVVSGGPYVSMETKKI
jgi:hypothetical protein